MAKTKKYSVGIMGCGAIGSELALFIKNKLSSHFTLGGIYDSDDAKLKALKKRLFLPKVYTRKAKILAACDVIIEAASIACARELIDVLYNKKKTLIVISVGVFIKYPRLIQRLQKGKCTIHIPSGAISGIDGISSFRLGKIHSLKLITSKPPASLRGAPYLLQKGIDPSKIKKERVIFKGSMQEAIKNFPQNINVAGTLFLASGYKGIVVVIKVDPHIRRNTHRIEVDASCGRLIIQTQNFPSKRNPKTSAVTVLSIKNLLMKNINHIKIGT